MTAADGHASAWARSVVANPEPFASPADVAALDEVHPQQLAAVADAHQVGPWLHAALASAGASNTEAAQLLQPVALAQAAIALAHERELSWLLPAFAERGIEVLVLKGPALARTHYPQRGLRPFRDLDLLVPERGLAEGAELLGEAGYERKEDRTDRLHAEHGHLQHVYLDRQRELRVELHGDHLQLGVEPAEAVAIWERASVVDFGGASARVLEPHDLLVHLCVHLHRHSFSRLIWFKDIDLLLRRSALDWDIVASRAEQQGCVDSVALTLELLEATLGTQLPPGARELLSLRPRWQRALQRVVWPTGPIVALEPQRRWRMRRFVQFAPENGLSARRPALVDFHGPAAREAARSLVDAARRRTPQHRPDARDG